MDKHILSGPVVIGVDQTEPGKQAAATGWAIAQAFGTEAHYIHAVRDRWANLRDVVLAAAATASATPVPASGVSAATLHPDERDETVQALLADLPDEAAESLHITVGRSAPAIIAYAEQHDASLIVVGGKHHAKLGRWVVGSTANDLVRTSPIPVLVVGDPPATISRVLVGVDLSPSAPAVLEFAQQLSARLEAAMLALHVVDDTLVESVYGPNIGRTEFIERSRALAEQRLWHTLTLPRTEKDVKVGSPIECLRQEAFDWDADLIVVGSHGHGKDRMLLGSTTEQLVNHLPASILVYPVA